MKGKIEWMGTSAVLRIVTGFCTPEESQLEGLGVWTADEDIVWKPSTFVLSTTPVERWAPDITAEEENTVITFVSGLQVLAKIRFEDFDKLYCERFLKKFLSATFNN